MDNIIFIVIDDNIANLQLMKHNLLKVKELINRLIKNNKNMYKNYHLQRPVLIEASADGPYWMVKDNTHCSSLDTCLKVIKRILNTSTIDDYFIFLIDIKLDWENGEDGFILGEEIAKLTKEEQSTIHYISSSIEENIREKVFLSDILNFNPRPQDDVLDLNLFNIFKQTISKIENKNLFNKYLSDKIVIGKSQKMMKLYEDIKMIAEGELSVLILGESGTGKTAFAKLIHEHSDRQKKEFVECDCPNITETLAGSELFGHEKGAFTDACTIKKGLFEKAHKGTIFIDEIGDLPLSLQAKLLKAIDNKKIRRLGGNEDIPADVYVISATNKNIETMVKDGSFREDLFYRINDYTLQLPSLREREEDDIKELAFFFLRQWINEKKAKKNNKLSCYDENHIYHTLMKVSELIDQSLPAFMKYRWKGNLRELKRVVKIACVKVYNGESNIKFKYDNNGEGLAFFESIENSPLKGYGETEMYEEVVKNIMIDLEKMAINNNTGLLKKFLNICEKNLITYALNKYDVKKDAADFLGLKDHRRLNYYLKKKPVNS